MKRITLFILLAAASTFFAACGAPAANTGANNANTNTTKPVAAAPTADALMALDKQANEAYVKGNSKFFDLLVNECRGRFHRDGPLYVQFQLSQGKCKRMFTKLMCV